MTHIINSVQRPVNQKQPKPALPCISTFNERVITLQILLARKPALISPEHQRPRMKTKKRNHYPAPGVGKTNR